MQRRDKGRSSEVFLVCRPWIQEESLEECVRTTSALTPAKKITARCTISRSSKGLKLHLLQLTDNGGLSHQFGCDHAAEIGCFETSRRRPANGRDGGRRHPTRHGRSARRSRGDSELITTGLHLMVDLDESARSRSQTPAEMGLSSTKGALMPAALRRSPGNGFARETWTRRPRASAFLFACIFLLSRLIHSILRRPRPHLPRHTSPFARVAAMCTSRSTSSTAPMLGLAFIMSILGLAHAHMTTWTLRLALLACYIPELDD